MGNCEYDPQLINLLPWRPVRTPRYQPHDRDGSGLRQLILPITEDAPRDAPRPPSSPARHAGHEDQVGLAAVCSGSPGLSFPVREGQGTPSGTSVPLRAPGTSGTCPALPHARPPSACTSPALVPSPLPGALRPCAPGAPRLLAPLASLGPSPPWAPRLPGPPSPPWNPSPHWSLPLPFAPSSTRPSPSLSTASASAQAAARSTDNTFLLAANVFAFLAALLLFW